MKKQPHLLVGKGEVNEIALLPGDPSRVEFFARLCDDFEIISENREYKIYNAEYEGKNITICSTGIGCPSAAIAIEELYRVGVKKMIRVGTAGAIQRGINIGEFVIATGAAKEEGTTKRYEPETYPAVAHHEIVSALIESSERQGVEFHVGAVVTDDAYYAETQEYIEKWKNAKLLAVEMETSVVLALSRRLGIQAGAILTIDGNLIEGSKKSETEEKEFSSETLDRIGKMGQIALDAGISI
jgi:uridine phosphorylase|tara:strand:+ start:79 stop:804 length:726 start_codon:yes stop_codon:yes gene_type:complete